ncbi:MAG: hypothetical protein Q8Q73_07035 [Stagnimonas sp.]|nr:hypothetical protein [Stagnimonas sp.]
MNRRPDLEKLIRFNVDVLHQGLQVLEAQAAVPGSDYGSHIGPHLRHVIEHYEALAQQLPSLSVDYDSRARDRTPERDPAVARARIEALQRQLHALDVDAVSEPIAIHLRGGLGGEENFVSFSTLARELLFVASHAVHHYALLQMHCKAQGIFLGEDFGKAPATVRHARAA